MDEVMGCICSRGREALLVGDVNAKSKTWGSPVTDYRGEYLDAWLASLNMVVHNTGELATFVRGDEESFVDVSCSTNRAARWIKNWRVSERENLTDHRDIEFDISADEKRPKLSCHRASTDWNLFATCFGLLAEGSAPDGYKAAQETIKSAYNASTNRTVNNRTTPYWWTVEVQTKKNECSALRRRVTRGGRRGMPAEERETILAAHRKAKGELRKLIRSLKREQWKELCRKVEEDPWGDGYRIVCKGLQTMTPYELDDESRAQIIRNLFLEDRQPERRLTEGIPPLHAEPFTVEDLMSAGKMLKTGKAPGLDGIPAEALRVVIGDRPEWLLGVLNNLLMAQSFPREWKSGKVVLIPKGGQTQGDLGSYRPITLLSSVSKLYEVMIRERLLKELADKGDLHENQWGFRRGRSTVEAVEQVRKLANSRSSGWCLLVTLDVSNAFNMACHGAILNALTARGISCVLIRIIKDYLADRRVVLVPGKTMRIGAGVPQGSVLGPILWNIMYDGVLRLDLEGEATTVAYADDLALVMQAGDTDELAEDTNVNLEKIDMWVKEQGLKLAPHKTEAMVLRGPRKRTDIVISLGDTVIPLKKTIKYLGITMDQWGIFGPHVGAVARKAEARCAALARLMPNIAGPSQRKRKLLAAVVENTILYGAPIWAGAMRVKRHQLRLLSVQRCTLLRVASAYRTASAMALQVITATVPIDLLVMERERIWGRRREDGQGIQVIRAEERQRTLRVWQERWEDPRESRAGWTKSVIPDIVKWVECPHRSLDYYLTQILTGHGCFGTYLKKIGKRTEDTCHSCGVQDTVQHTVLECTKWSDLREEVRRRQVVKVERWHEEILSGEDKWKEFHDFIRNVMLRKEKEDREAAQEEG